MSRLLLAALMTVLAVQPALATDHHRAGGDDRVSFGSDITVEADDTVGDIACAFCKVHVHGDVKGDVAVLFGSVDLDASHTISGDVAVLGGDVSVADDATIHGDLALAAGNLHLSPDATIHGDRVVFPGLGWLLVPFAPIFILIGIIWLIVWLFQRNRRPYPLPLPGRRY